MGKGKQKVKKRDGSRLGCAVGDDLRRAVEGRNKDGNGKVDKNTYYLRHSDRTEDAEPGAFFCPFILFCPEVLADKGGEGERKTGDGQETEAFDLGISAAPGHRHFAKFVNIALDDHVGEGNDRVLEPCGEAVGDDLS